MANAEQIEQMEQVSKEKLVEDFKVVVADAEELLRATASQTGEKVVAARQRIEESLGEARRRLAIVQAGIVEKSKQAARVTDEYVHDHPWQSIGVSAAIGFLVGLLAGRR